jgi:glycosyltransferase involved in cell wall biosynthesis
MPAITVKALNEAGHKAKGLVLQSSITQSSEGMIVYNYSKKSPFKIFVFFVWYIHFLRLLLWADVIHWCGSFSKDLLKFTLPVIKFLNKPALVEFVGSDIRNPEIEFKDNPYYKEVFYKGYEYAYESAENSISTQKLFAKAGFNVIAMPGMEQYIDKSIFPEPFRVFQRIDTSKFEFLPPDPNKIKPLIVHAPTAPICKGTKYITDAIEELRKEFDFSFELIINIPHKTAKEKIKKCDIFIDQLILGSYGMATMEALSYGKPVMCFIKESVLTNEFPNDIPIINTNPKTIISVLKKYLDDSHLRNKCGKKSREFAKKYHDTKSVIPQLIETYNASIKQRF